MFRPKIIGFACNWSLPMEAGLSSASRIRGYPKVSFVRVMCVGRIDPTVVLQTFIKGADGVLVIGCHPPDCHYIEGNLLVERKMRMLKKLMSRTGLEPERLQLGWAYASESERFSKIIDDFREQLATLGPSPIGGERPDTKMLLSMKAAKAAAEDFRLRVLIGREKELIEVGNVYGEKVSREKFDEIMDDVINAEHMRNRIYLMVKKEPFSVKELSKHLDLDSPTVLRHMVVMKQRGWITVDRVEGNSPIYTALEVA